ncbi:hypothetical protein GE09DRAFT_387996 [Coniochaeta sp. 2T2.1]|nr:hypothetical protein GE09DRAFT_387996 [Coniochaeta sp. 2T2.1]
MIHILPEVLLTIANNADSQTIYGLMLTCRGFHQLLSSYERSIVKTKLEAYYRSAIDPRVFSNPRLAKDHPILQLSRDQTGTLLTSATPKRTVANPYTFAVAHELEVRESRIQPLIGPSGSLTDIVTQLHHSCSSSSHSSDADVLPHVLTQLASIRRACRISDIIGDAVAHIVAKAGWIDGYNAHLSDNHHAEAHNACRCNAWVSCLTGLEPPLAATGGVTASSMHMLQTWLTVLPSEIVRRSLPPSASQDAKNMRILMSKLTHRVRAAQLDLIRRLSAFDLVSLVKLAEVAGVEYTLRLGDDRHESDPEHVEKRTAFQESVFRRGASLSLWAIGGRARECVKVEDVFTYEMPEDIPPRMLCERQAEDAVRSIHAELAMWELGVGFERVEVDEVFEPVGDEEMAGLARAFGDVVDAGDGDDEVRSVVDSEDSESEVDGNSEPRTVPAMQRGLQPTLIRCLSRTSQKCLNREERMFARRMRPSYGTSSG